MGLQSNKPATEPLKRSVFVMFPAYCVLIRDICFAAMLDLGGAASLALNTILKKHVFFYFLVTGSHYAAERLSFNLPHS